MFDHPAPASGGYFTVSFSEGVVRRNNIENELTFATKNRTSALVRVHNKIKESPDACPHALERKKIIFIYAHIG
jgi:hypothetical protein